MLALLMMAALPATVAMAAGLPALRLVVAAEPGRQGLDADEGQHHVRLAGLRDGRVVVAYAQGYAAGCGLFDRCRHYPETWHFVAARNGVVVAPSRTWPTLDLKPGINNYSRRPFNALATGDGHTAVVGLAHSSHNSDGAHFVRIDASGRVISRAGGVAAFGSQVCTMGQDVVVFVVWSDPSSAGYVWFGDGNAATGEANLGGYGYNFPGTVDATCGYSAVLGSRFALLAREVEASHVGLALHRIGTTRWTPV
ncbi:MAG: hypothetical protein RLZZ393_1521, partial [Pseudomonadota bacterium]